MQYFWALRDICFGLGGRDSSLLGPGRLKNRTLRCGRPCDRRLLKQCTGRAGVSADLQPDPGAFQLELGNPLFRYQVNDFFDLF